MPTLSSEWVPVRGQDRRQQSSSELSPSVCVWRPIVEGPTLDMALAAALSAARIALRGLRQPQLRLALPPRALSLETSHQLIHHVICLHSKLSEAGPDHLR